MTEQAFQIPGFHIIRHFYRAHVRLQPFANRWADAGCKDQ
jgi:hypothetical protein